MNKVQIVIIVISIIAVIIAVVKFAGFQSGPTFNPGGGASGTLTIWGSESSTFFEKAVLNYKQANGISITYVQKDPRTFDREIVEALASKTGPDLIITTTSWIADNHNKLTPPTAEIITPETFSSTFVDLATFSFIENKTIWALPLWIDPLVLYWNKDLFNAKSIALPPKDWDEFTDDSQVLAIIAGNNSIERAGAAMGRARNIPRYKEILSLLLLQQRSDIEGGLFDLAVDKRNASISPVRFYTDFGKSGVGIYTWNTTLPQPQELFGQGKLGMMLDFASAVPIIERASPHATFAISGAPQTRGSEAPIHTADVIGITVAANSKQYLAAWKFAEWLSGSEGAPLLLDNHIVAPARRDLLANPKLASRPYFSLLRGATLNARRPRDTYPGLTSEIIGDMIESIADGRLAVSEAIENARQRFLRFQEENRKK